MNNDGLTVISHIYNEEYLLPFWLEHHRTIFKNGVIIDYNSTDRSREIIYEYCPHWKVIQSENHMFESEAVDREVMKIESSISGYKIALNTTEFLLISPKQLPSNSLNCFNIPTINAVSSKDNIFPNTLSEFFSGIEKIATDNNYTNRGIYRFLHNYDHGHYRLGRHETLLNISSNSINAAVLWVGMYPWNTETVKRKMGIKVKIPDSDKIRGLGSQHQWNEEYCYAIKNILLDVGISICDLPEPLKQLLTDIIQR
jgi:hypothetical protein